MGGQAPVYPRRNQALTKGSIAKEVFNAFDVDNRDTMLKIALGPPKEDELAKVMDDQVESSRYMWRDEKS